MRKRSWGDATTAVHAGESIDPGTGAVVTPLYQASTFTYPRRPTPEGGWTDSNWFYTRYGNPTVAAVQERVAALEGTDAAMAFASGMGAIANTIFANVRAGERIATMAHIYGGTTSLLAEHAPRFGIEVDTCPTMDAGELADTVTETTSVVHTETPTNPFNRVLDLPRLRALLDKRWGRSRPKIVMDSTFATPINLRPVSHGADYAVHSATKYLNGHADIIGGVVAGSKANIDRLVPWLKNFGACMDPHQAFLLGRGIKTLEVRLRRQEKNAKAVAEALESHRKVEAVWHLSLPSHPDYALGRKLLHGPGAIVTLKLRSHRGKDATRFMQALELFAPAPSLGGVESLVSLPIETSHARATPAQRKVQGIAADLVRLAVGVETASDVVDDVRKALRVV